MLPITPIPSLIGMMFDAQYIALDPTGAALGFSSATPAIEFVLGSQQGL